MPLARICLLVLLAGALSPSHAQDTTNGKNKKDFDYFSIALTNNHSAYPFSSFAGLVTGEWHTGFELGTGFNWTIKQKHDWYQEFRLGYFYHQYIQHGIPLYTSFGYRYKFSPVWTAQAGLGVGYFHSIPDHDRFKLNADGDYEEINNPGRGQAMAVFNLGAGYAFARQSRHPLQVFVTYQQRLQMPYIQSYVPLLPYNTLMLGIKRFKATKN
jgi:hypothetical protein